METTNQPQPIMADITQTTPLETWSGGQIWAKGYILRVLPGEDGDQLLPFEVFFDPQTGKILDNTLPEELRSEYGDSNSFQDQQSSNNDSNDDSNDDWGTWDNDTTETTPDDEVSWEDNSTEQDPSDSDITWD